MPDVTVVIATANRAAQLRTTLAQLGGLPDRPDVIVVDNGSRDSTVETARGAGVRVIALGRNRGAMARNVGVQAASTPYVAFADDDSWWKPGALDSAAGHFDAHPRLALVAARTLVGPSRFVDPMSEFMASAPLGRQPDLPGPSVLGFLACAAVVRRSAFLAAGGFDRVLFFMGEEGRVAYDLAAAGWGLAYCDDVVSLHHPKRDLPATAAKRQLARRNAVLTMWLRRPLRMAIGATAALSVGSAADRSVLAEVLRRLPAALWHRRPPVPRVERDLARLAIAESTGGRESPVPVPSTSPRPPARAAR
jgi:GT2 family glycosyltransferase